MPLHKINGVTEKTTVVPFGGKSEKEKAEAYVRSQIPELMELSFGCDVKQVDTYTVIGGVDHSLHVRRHSDGKIFDSLTIGPNWTIIGHPIQLQHWLRVLDMKSKRYVVCTDGTCCYVQAHGHLEPVFCFNLTTGQPATEADYKAFNEIVGKS